METLHILLPTSHHLRLKAVAHRKKVSVSQLIRTIFFNPLQFPIPKSASKRPPKFQQPTQRFTLCLHDKKSYWLATSRALSGELGPIIRYLIEIYLPYLDQLDLSESNSKKIKETKIYPVGSAYAYHVDTVCFEDVDSRAGFEGPREIFEDPGGLKPVFWP